MPKRRRQRESVSPAPPGPACPAPKRRRQRESVSPAPPGPACPAPKDPDSISLTIEVLRCDIDGDYQVGDRAHLCKLLGPRCSMKAIASGVITSIDHPECSTCKNVININTAIRKGDILHASTQTYPTAVKSKPHQRMVVDSGVTPPDPGPVEKGTEPPPLQAMLSDLTRGLVTGLADVFQQHSASSSSRGFMPPPPPPPRRPDKINIKYAPNKAGRVPIADRLK